MRCFLLVLMLACVLPGTNSVALKFRQDGTFKILQITDIHFEGYSESDARTNEIQAGLLQAERPDLVVFSGDLVGGYACPFPCKKGWFRKRFKQLLLPVLAAQVPWALTLGNHDTEADLNGRAIVDLAVSMGGNLSLTRQGPVDVSGAANFWLDVHDPLGTAPAARIWLLDSGSQGCDGSPAGYGCVERDTLAWVQRTAPTLPAVPSTLGFVHIPIPQFMEMWDTEATVGSKAEWVACSGADTGLFQLAQQLGIQAIYSGHDHDNDYLGEIGSLRLAYGRKTGQGSYGPPEGWLRGARVIELRLGESAARSATWIRQEDGSRMDQGASREPKSRDQHACVGPSALKARLKSTAGALASWLRFIG